MDRRVLILLAGAFAAALLGATGANGDTTILPANYSFEDDDASAEGYLEGPTYPSGWTFIQTTGNQYLDIINNDAFWGAGSGFENVTGAQYCWLFGVTVSPGITQTLGDTVKPGTKYQLSADLAGELSDSSVGATLTLNAGTDTIATTAITTDQLTDGVFQSFSTDLVFPSQSLVGQALTITITPGSFEPDV